MPTPSVLVLYNQPLLPIDHPDAASEHTIVPIANALASILSDADFRVSQLGLGPDPTVLWRELHTRCPSLGSGQRASRRRPGRRTLEGSGRVRLWA